MNLRTYATGSTFPPLTSGTLRLYSMRFCPYSQRVRLILAAKNVPYETININSKRKPEWFSELAALGLPINHPCLQHDDGRVVYESNIICDYLDNLYPENKLISADLFTKARHQMLIEGFQRVVALLFKALKFKDPEAFNEINKIMEGYEKFLTDDYFGGKNPGLADYMIWPWFERFESLKSLTNKEFEHAKFKKLSKWIKRMLSLPAVKETASDPKELVEFYKVSLTNQEPPYDIGLPEPEPEPAPAEGEPSAESAEAPKE